MAAIQQDLLDALAGEGITKVEALAVTMKGFGWESRAAGFDTVHFPVMPDVAGQVHALYSASPYDGVLIDNKGRIVEIRPGYSSSDIPELKSRIRDLHAE